MDNFKSILKDGTAALIITDVNRRYLTGFESSLGYLFVTENGAILLTDGRYYLAAKQSVKNAEVVLLTKLSEQLTEWVRENKIKTLLLESAVTVSVFNRIKGILSGVEVVADGSVDKRLAELRSVKTAEELQCIIAAQRIAEKAFLEVLNFIKIGVSEHRLATELEYRMRLL